MDTEGKYVCVHEGLGLLHTTVCLPRHTVRERDICPGAALIVRTVAHSIIVIYDALRFCAHDQCHARTY